MIPDVLRELGDRFTPDQYLYWSRIEGTLWTLADFVIVVYLTRTVNLARAFLAMPRRLVPYVLLAATVPPAAFIPFVHDSRAFFALEVAVTLPHFGIILWLILRDARLVIDAVYLRSRTVSGGIAPTSDRVGLR